MNVRLEGFHILFHVLEEGQYSHIELQNFMKKYPDEPVRDKAFVQRLVRGTLEHLILIDAAIDSVSKTKVKKQKPAIRTILRLSACQMLYMDTVPDSAVCNEAVKLAVKLKFTALKGFVNGVLRSLSRNIAGGYRPEPVDPVTKEELALYYSIPLWIVDELLSLVSADQFKIIAEAMRSPVKLSVFNNCCRQNLPELKAILTKEGIETSPLPYGMEGFYLEHVNSLEKSKAFAQGRFLVQDYSSMLEGLVAAPKDGQYIIDACAAPGGKSFHAAIAMHGTGLVESGDIGKAKIRLLQENAKRLGLNNIRISNRDALKPDTDLIGKADILIADLPCSGLGIMGRKPEIRYNVKAQDIKELAGLQRRMLDNLCSYVKPGGRLIYSTCTITKEENTENYFYLTEELPFKAESLDSYLPEALHSETTKKGYLQLLPGIHPSDGFFIGSAIRV